MHYQISRNGQLYGPYTMEDLQRYLASGNVLPTDMAKSESMPDWVAVSQLVGGVTPPAAEFATPGYANPTSEAPFAQPGSYAQPGAYGQPMAPMGALANSPYQDPPNLNWGLVLLFSVLTCTLFMWIWNLIVAAWLKRVQPNATSLFYYLGAVVLLFVQISIGATLGMHHAMRPGLHMYSDNPFGALIGLAVWVVRLVARYSQRASLEEHFNGPEPVGLRLSPVMTFFFGGLYFQYHLNRIMTLKQAARFQAGRGY